MNSVGGKEGIIKTRPGTLKRRRLVGSTAVAVLSAALITACGSQVQAEDEENGESAAFSSMEEAYAAVDEVLNCEADPAGDPIVPRAGGQLPSEQKLCAENLQIDLFPDHDSLQAAFEIWNGSQQGPVHIVQGSKWMVVDVTEVATDKTPTWNLKGLAQELNGEYSEAGK